MEKKDEDMNGLVEAFDKFKRQNVVERLKLAQLQKESAEANLQDALMCKQEMKPEMKPAKKKAPRDPLPKGTICNAKKRQEKTNRTEGFEEGVKKIQAHVEAIANMCTPPRT